MTLHPDPDPAHRPIDDADGWLVWQDIPPAPPGNRRGALIALADHAADIHGPALHAIAAVLIGRPVDGTTLDVLAALDDLVTACRNIDALDLGGADPAQMLGDDYAGPNGRDLAREHMLAAQRDALDRLLGGAP